MLSRPLRLALLIAVSASTSGCWFFAKREPERPAANTRLAHWGVGALGVVKFDDATLQGVAERVSERYLAVLQRALGTERVRRTWDDPAVSLAAPASGHIGIGTAQTVGRTFSVDALVTGQVRLYSWQRARNRFAVTVSLRLLDSNRGSIMWARTTTGAVNIRTETASPPDSAIDTAIDLAAKDFLNDLLAPPLAYDFGPRDGFCGDRQRQPTG